MQSGVGLAVNSTLGQDSDMEVKDKDYVTQKPQMKGNDEDEKMEDFESKQYRVQNFR